MWTIRLGAIGILVSGTIGAGIFALPYVMQTAGWGAFLGTLVFLGALLAGIHALYSRALERTPGKHRLAGLAHLYIPRRLFPFAAGSIFGGLALTLVAYLILGATFIRLLIPSVPYSTSLAIMWAIGALPLFFRMKRVVAMEFVGTLAIASLITFIFASAEHISSVFSMPAVAHGSGALFLPFAPILFSLAGWASIGAMRDYEQKVGIAHRPRVSSIVIGTAVIAALYALFAAGVIGSAGANGLVSPDTISGLASWPPLRVKLLAFLGLLAISMVHIPVAEEARGSLERDFGWNEHKATLLVALLPLTCVALGLTNFFDTIGVAGGVFLSVNYIVVALVIKNALPLSRRATWFMNFTIFVFLAAAIYEIAAFVVR
jgi:amino acid permease